MSIQEMLSSEMKRAMKSKESLRLSTIRLLKAAITSEEKRDGKSLSEDKILEIVGKEIKKRNESIEAFRKGGRNELAEKEEKEREFIRELFPDMARPLSEEEVRSMVREVIASLPEEKAPHIGMIMPLVLPRVKGKADGKAVNRIVKEELEKQEQV